MPDCTLVLTDQVNCQFVGLDPVLRQRLVDQLRVMVPYARHTPLYRLGRWDGTISFATMGGGTYINLLDQVLPLVLEAGYQVTLDDRRTAPPGRLAAPAADLVAEYRWPDGHRLAGQPILLRDDQCRTVQTFIEHPQAIQIVPTGAGKTLVTACLSRLVDPHGRSLVIVPSKSLVVQTAADYRLVGLDVGLYFGDSKDTGRRHTIATWQSLAALMPRRGQPAPRLAELVAGLAAVIVDEVHGAKAACLSKLLCGPLAGVPWRWGLSGTFPKEQCDALTLLATLGPRVGEIRATTLQADGVLAACEVRISQLQDPDMRFRLYQDEYEFLIGDPDRLLWVAEYCRRITEHDGNTLILVGRIDTGTMLQTLLPEAAFVHGEVQVKARQREYDQVQWASRKIIIATYGVAAIGINIPRLFNVVLFEPGKSFVRVIQSIGRGLRLAEDKRHVVIHDLASNLRFSTRHLHKRQEYYREVGYPFSLATVAYPSTIGMLRPRRRTPSELV